MHKYYDWLRGVATRYSDYLVGFGLLLVLWIALLPILSSGYFGDDVVNSYTKGIRLFDGVTLYDFTYHYFMSWITSQGRFFPLVWYVYWLFEVCDTLFIYKLFSVISVLICCFTFGYFVFKLTRDKNLGIFVVISLAVIFQCRIYHDPLLSFQYLLQVVLLEITLSLIFFLIYLESSRWISLILSLFFYLCALLTYEISYAFFLFHFILALGYKNNFRENVRVTSPYFLLSLMAIVVSMYLRSKATAIDPTYQINFHILVYLKTLGTQIVSSLPLIYYIANPSHISVYNPVLIVKKIDASGLIGATVFFVIFYRIVNNLKTGFPSRIMVTLGLALMVVPGLMTSLSVKHQKMHLGLGYLPVFLQYFGTALVLLSFVSWALTKTKNDISRERLSLALTGLFSVAYLINLQNNWSVVSAVNTQYLFPRQVLEQALQNGLLLDVPQHSTLFIESANVWGNKYFVYQYSSKKLNVINAGSVDAYRTETIDKASKHKVVGKYILKYHAKSLHNGYVMLGRYKNDSKIYATTPAAYIDSLKVYFDSQSPKYLLAAPGNGTKVFISKLPTSQSIHNSDFNMAEVPLIKQRLNFNTLNIYNCN
ncbi:MAG: hypothetical protein A2Y21_09050 [Clostridiales bacterium GWC2_40_7]|nr:MAG: hypothetical protein A2Y21_09050 [Clostridiales bacterium GWC2_40_7]